ncbi:hypothetical protein AADG42_18270 [Ammonicoccus fulvus]|uniref:Uncharacterized protein n=1 Tax=Ammonicoccus fulvus TaxID=3138240 RepID=A0ABZ3FTW7_9ACTN
MSWVLAIALGASATWAARDMPGVRNYAIDLLPLGEGKAELPSAVWIGDDAILVGEEALARGAGSPEGLMRNPYAVLGEGDGSEAIDHVAVLLAETHRRAVAAAGSWPERTLLTHPDGWSMEQVMALRQAVTRAGLGVDLVTEPVALASAYRHDGGEGSRLLVLDPARGSASAVARMGRVFIVMATENGAGSEDVIALAERALARPGVRPELLNEILLAGDTPDSGLAETLDARFRQEVVQMPTSAMAAGALHYNRSLHEVPPRPAPEPPPPAPAPEPVVRVNHAAPPAKKKGLPIVPLLLGILAVLIIAELLFVYWPF